jgi:FKBP-type peptidyl-prolyl cis-trans isomerase
VRPGDTVAFRYELRRYGGAVLEGNLTAPHAAEMPVAGLVPGFAEGLTHMRPGGEARFWIPPQLGYGDSPPNGISPTDTLEFLVRLERIVPAGASGHAAAAADRANAAATAEGGH